MRFELRVFVTRSYSWKLQYSQRGTFIWTPITAIYLNVFAENDHRDRCFFPIFRVVIGVQNSPAANTAGRGVRTPRISMAGHSGPSWLIAYFIQFTCTLCRRWKSVDRDDLCSPLMQSARDRIKLIRLWNNSYL